MEGDRDGDAVLLSVLVIELLAVASDVADVLCDAVTEIVRV